MESKACDFETYSACDLKTAGLDNYARHESTGIHCFSWGDDPLDLQTWHEGEPFPEELRGYVAGGGVFTAWNAPFELAIWLHCAVRKYGWPVIRPEQFQCSMAKAYAMSLPGALEKAAAALGVAEQKDMKGARVMMQLAQPKADGSFWTKSEAPEKFEQLFGYNRQDVRTELAACDRLMELSDYEQKIWQIDYRINQRGIQIDLAAVNAAIKLVESEKARLNAEMLKATGGVVGSCTEVQLLVKWIRSQGVELAGVAKAGVLDALNGELPDAVRTALVLRKEAAKSSTAKLIAMRDAVSADGRVRGILQYHGANTGRWAGRRIQVQNFPRGFLKPAEVEDVFKILRKTGTSQQHAQEIDILYAPPLDVISSCLRGMIVAKPGHDLVAADFANIENRVLPWLANEEWKVRAFREFDAGTGPDLYLVAVSRGRGISIAEAKPFRQEGKVEELAFQFGGGKGAMSTWCRTFGMEMADDEKELRKVRWREAHPRIVAYWHDLESAAINAVQLGCVCKAGAGDRVVSFIKRGSFLWAKLPSGRVLCYPYPTVRDVEVPWGGTKPALFYMSVNGVTNKWEETNTYGGSLAENVTQAVARDLLADALVRLEDNGFPVVMHVHDEVVVEVPQDAPADTVQRVEELISKLPKWAVGLPVSAEGWRGARYRK